MDLMAGPSSRIEMEGYEGHEEANNHECEEAMKAMKKPATMKAMKAMTKPATMKAMKAMSNSDEAPTKGMKAMKKPATMKAMKAMSSSDEATILSDKITILRRQITILRRQLELSKGVNVALKHRLGISRALRVRS